MINLFVTDTLGYDIDRDRTGGCLMGPLPPGRRSGGDERLLALATAPRCFDSGLPCLRRFGVGQVILTILKIDIHEVVGRISRSARVLQDPLRREFITFDPLLGIGTPV